MDGIDAVLMRIIEGRCQTLGGLTQPYPAHLHTRLHAAIAPHARLSLHELATLDIEVGECFASAALALLERCDTDGSAVVAIGSHGQTLRHAPRGDWPYSMQIGSPAVIAARVGITTVADFRSMDIAYGGEGAPLVPAFHEWLLRMPGKNRVIANIGGIANLSLLPASGGENIRGYDTGPGNCLMDSWTARHLNMPFDADGTWASSGVMNDELLKALLEDPYFSEQPPKSTGREVFNLAYLDAVLARPAFASLTAADIQSTLAELTVETLAREVERQGSRWATELLICGGGAHNAHLMRRLSERLATVVVSSTQSVGVDPDLVEACAFGWLAYMRLENRPVRVTTGARDKAVILGAVYSPTGRING